MTRKTFAAVVLVSGVPLLAGAQPVAEPPSTENGSQQPTLNQPQFDAPAAERGLGLIWTGDLKGRDIRTPQGEELGEIEGVLLDQAEARVSYVTVEFGGFLGIGRRLVPVPWDALQPAADGESYVLNITEDVLRAAPSVRRDNFEEVADSNWQQAVEAYWSQRAGLVPR